MKALEISKFLARFFFPRSQSRIDRFSRLAISCNEALATGRCKFGYCERDTRQDTSDMGAAKLLLVLLLHGADQKELANTRPEIVSLIERRRLSTIFSRSKQTILPRAVAGQTTRRRKDKIWQKQ
jgi:hypothetical protein